MATVYGNDLGLTDEEFGEAMREMLSDEKYALEMISFYPPEALDEVNADDGEFIDDAGDDSRIEKSVEFFTETNKGSFTTSLEQLKKFVRG